MTIDVEVVETSSLGDRSYLVHDGHVAVVIDPQRDIDRVWPGGRRGVRITARGRDARAQRLRHRRPGAGAGAPARPTWSTRPTRWPSTACRSRDGDVVDVPRRCGSGCWPPRGTPHPPVYVLRRPRGGRSAVFTGGSLLYGVDRPHRPARPRRTPTRWRTPVRLGAPAGRPSCPTMRRSSRRTVRQLLLGHPVRRGDLVHHRPGEADQPGADPG